MSVKYGSTTNLITKQIPIAGKPAANIPPDYVRPSDWLTLPTVGLTEQKFVGLLAVTDDDSNYVALLAIVSGAGTYTVDWGDGSSPQTYTSNTKAQYQYTYSSISDTTISARGYKQVIITVTPTSTNLTNIAIQQLSSLVKSAGVITKWLDIAVGSPNLTGLTIAGSLLSALVTKVSMLEQVSIISSSATSYNSLLKGCNALQSCPTLACSSVTNMDSMFQECIALRKAPDMITTTVTNMGQMFLGCIALEYIPEYDCTNLTQVAGFSNGFAQNCYSLVIAPNLNLSKVTKTDNMFAGCSSLTQVPNYDLSNSTSANSMFSTCISLITIPYLKTPKLQYTASMFSGCTSLESLYSIDTANVTDSSFMFNGCLRLNIIPNLNLNKVATTTSMFSTCRNIVNFPTLNLPNVTSAGSMFNGCTSLIETPNIIAPKMVTATGLFSSCTNIEFANNIDLPNVTNSSTMFVSCPSLKYANNINLPNITTSTQMFAACNNLVEIPSTLTGNKITTATGMFSGCSRLANISNTFDMNNVAVAGTMFQTCTMLTFIPDLNTSKLSTAGSMFDGCGSLIKIGNLNLTNVGSASNMFTSCPSLAKMDITNLKITVTLATQNHSKTSLEEIFTNLGGNTTSQTITITSNPGADTAVAKTGNTTNNSNVIVMANTVGLSTGMYVTAAGLNSLITTHNGIAVVVSSGFLPTANSVISFNAFTNVTNLSLNTIYYVKQPLSNQFQISLTPGGAAVQLNNTSTAGTCTLRYPNQIVAISPNANITISEFANFTNTAVAISGRILNTQLAIMKNWTVTG